VSVEMNDRLSEVLTKRDFLQLLSVLRKLQIRLLKDRYLKRPYTKRSPILKASSREFRRLSRARMYHCTIFRLMDSFMERRASEDQNNGARWNHPASAKHFELCGAVWDTVESVQNTAYQQRPFPPYNE
jgi:hypothetical protein